MGGKQSKKENDEPGSITSDLSQSKEQIHDILSQAKEDFYQGNEYFRKAGFQEAKSQYLISLEKLKKWNECMHPERAKHEPTPQEALKSPPPTPVTPAEKEHTSTHPESLIPSSESNEKDLNDPANVKSNDTALTLQDINLSIQGPKAYETAAMMNLGMIQFIEGCYKESKDLLHQALEKHRQFSHPFYLAREERVKERQRSHSSTNSTRSNASRNVSNAPLEHQDLSMPSLTSLSVLIKRDMSLIKSHGNERVLVSKLNEFSTLDAMIADLLNNLAACYEVMGELEMAKTLFQEALQLRMIVYGRQSLKVAETMQNLATILDALGAYATSEEYLTEALEIEKKELGEGHIETAITMNNLGVLLAHVHNYDRAKELLEESVRLRENFYGSHHHLTLCARQNLEYVSREAAAAQQNNHNSSSDNSEPVKTADSNEPQFSELEKENQRNSVPPVDV